MKEVCGLDLATAVQVYRSIITTREIDTLEREYVQRGEAFFHVSAAGHENIAFLQPHLRVADYLHCHYRDKSLMLERGVTIQQFFLSLFCKDQSHSRGRQMSAHISDRANNILSTVGPVGNNALQAVGVASLLKNGATGPIVYCGMGDGTTQQGEVLEAIAHAVREVLPVLFVIHDNSLAISTRTAGRTFFSRPDGEASEFYGLPIIRIDGRDPVQSFERFGEVVAEMRQSRAPAIVVFRVARLDSHTNADDHNVYRTAEEISNDWLTSDPVAILETWLEEQGVAPSDIQETKKEVQTKVRAAAEEAQQSREPTACLSAKADLPIELTDRAREYRGSEVADSGQRFTMLESLREVFKFRMAEDPRITLFGEDLEDPKGDVFGLTKGLTELFPGRVVNSPLAESSIVGLSIGQALAGGRPVCFLQFADFFPIAFNQIWAELASIFWRTAGDWKAPVIVMATCGGFKPGLGPFHASSMEAFAAHIPGVDVFLPATAADAAGLLNASFESERPTVFFYPKSLLNDRKRATSSDVSRQLVPIGRARLCRSGNNLTLLGWGNLVGSLERAAIDLEQSGIACDLIDLRSISPWDCELVLESVAKTGNLLIAQEDNLTVSVASEIAATVAEKLSRKVNIRRVSRADTFVPCNFSNQLEVLPSYREILETAVQMLGGKISWHKSNQADGCVVVEAIGSSPADQGLTVLEWKVQQGDRVEKGQILAEVEADKAIFEIAAPADGVLDQILVPVAKMVEVGTAIAKIRPTAGATFRKPVTREEPGIPAITWPTGSAAVCNENADRSEANQQKLLRRAEQLLGIAAISSQVAGRQISNLDLAKICPEWDADQIFERFGIKNRYWVDSDESVLSLAVSAAQRLLDAEKLGINQIDLLLVTTGTPPEITPSLACLLLAQLSRNGQQNPFTQAVDLNAACSGYLYALQYAYDFLSSRPDGRVLLVTSEVLSQALDVKDPATAPIFGDAATATLLVGSDRFEQVRLALGRPVLGAQGDDGSVLRVPRDLQGKIFMDGPRVYHAAVKNMVLFLEKACQEAGLQTDHLDLVIAHQANQRILDSVRLKARLDQDRVYSAIADFGNTSSSSIPLCLHRLWPALPTTGTWGLCSFGGGFTFGGAVLRVR